MIPYSYTTLRIVIAVSLSDPHKWCIELKSLYSDGTAAYDVETPVYL